MGDKAVHIAAQNRKKRVTRLDYCQYLLVSQIFTLIHYADHTEKFSHDMANHYLLGDKIHPQLVWENVQHHVVPTPYGFDSARYFL